ncbi:MULTISPECIES: ribosome recycling factor [Pseudomonas]|jgi:ribosome recycling factor|uniref:Ribosome-recycling factor n=1 Tax=Pseudomonas gingeri TaxID=117681 RepID=A0A7Y7WNV8_9PSED|nr:MULTISPECIES: ribosome recycling factor [Pseudomonas]MBV6750330.1 ribosome recycling factor [Pseudomonas chlororaphis]RBH54714.1 ribosome recycling factor [Pseudomonas sp. MWU13-2860]MCU1738764.1 ribosome recycling factor [Pseudomonas sp. 20S_6.2_Bac1]MPQ68962.1 ribosome recycling factor [Pseudomonas sp. MWU12-2323]NWA23648.1 ribosome recycling factor [Pseudomonas gingeri]
MINEIKKDAQERMKKSLESLAHAFGRIRTGQAHPSILEGVMVPYYGTDTPIKQVANITVKDARTLQVVAFERNMLGAVDKAIGSAGLNLNPTNLGELLLISMPALTEETRRGFTKQAREEAENARIAVRNIRRDVLGDLKDLVKEKEISEDEERRAADDIQKLTDKFVAEIEVAVKQKEADLMAV